MYWPGIEQQHAVYSRAILVYILNDFLTLVLCCNLEENMTKEKLALEIIERLKKEYPDAGCTLDYDQAWKLLVSVRLAAQCTDARVNVVVEGLYEKFPDVDALAAADVAEIEEIVRPCGLGKSKARDISACMKILKEDYDGKIPKDFNALLKLPGVGRKSANLIMGDVFGEPAIVTDTHCIRLVNRMGLVDGIKEPKKERWRSGRSSLPRKAVTSATAWSTTEEISAPLGRSRTATAAAYRTSARRTG